MRSPRVPVRCPSCEKRDKRIYRPEFLQAAYGVCPTCKVPFVAHTPRHYVKRDRVA